MENTCPKLGQLLNYLYKVCLRTPLCDPEVSNQSWLNPCSPKFLVWAQVGWPHSVSDPVSWLQGPVVDLTFFTFVSQISFLKFWPFRSCPISPSPTPTPWTTRDWQWKVVITALAHKIAEDGRWGQSGFHRICEWEYIIPKSMSKVVATTLWTHRAVKPIFLGASYLSLP